MREFMHKPKQRSVSLAGVHLVPLWQTFILFCTVVTSLAADHFGGTGPWPENSMPTVNCIAHDAKYTCDCNNAKEQMVLPRLTGFVFYLEVTNCKVLTIEAHALQETQSMHKITMKNITRLELKTNALAFQHSASNTPLIITFEQVDFGNIESHAINGYIEKISFIGGSIENMHPFGFTTLNYRAVLLKMDGVWIRRIESQAFKKFSVAEMDISNCIFDFNLPSKAFYELEVFGTLNLSNNKFKVVHSRAFSFRKISKLFIINNYFESVDAEWIEAHVRESIVIRDNHFGLTSSIAFKGLAVHREFIFLKQMELPFINNSVRFAMEQPRPLDFNERFVLNLKQLYYDNSYSCQLLDTAQTPPKPKAGFFRTHVDSILFLPEAVSSSANQTLDNHQSYVALSQIIESQCRQRSYLWYIVFGVLGIILVLALIALTAWLLWARKRKRRKLDVVLPEPRTYKETQIVYQIENAGLLKTDL